MKKILLLVILAGAIISCSKLLPAAPADDEILDGPVEGLTNEQRAIFLRGDIAFNDEVFTTETGLGPYLLPLPAVACHAGDGKGHPFTTLTRFGQSDTLGNQFLQPGGPQLQHRAIPDFMPEQIPAGATFSKFMPPANTGLGFLDAVPDATLLALADENDANGDGISGRPNWIAFLLILFSGRQLLKEMENILDALERKQQRMICCSKRQMPITRIWALLQPLNLMILIAVMKLIPKITKKRYRMWYFI